MRSFLSLSLCCVLLTACASAVVPDNGDSGVQPDAIAMIDTVLVVDAPGPRDALQCGDPLSPCDGRCVDTRSDSFNCGGCGRVCAVGSACRDGNCELVCFMPEIACGGRCVDPTADPANC